MHKEECRCEHAAHFHDEPALTPNGNHGHEYGVEYYSHFIVTVQTPYGKFKVCRDCASDCYQYFQEIESK